MDLHQVAFFLHWLYAINVGNVHDLCVLCLGLFFPSFIFSSHIKYYEGTRHGRRREVIGVGQGCHGCMCPPDEIRRSVKRETLECMYVLTF